MSKIKYKEVGDGYICQEAYTYYSPRFKKAITITRGFFSDGATYARDIDSDAWWVHDVLCRYGVWNDGTKISNWDASTVLGDILWSEGYFIRAIYWWWATFILGGGAARRNGMWSVKGVKGA